MEVVVLYHTNYVNIHYQIATVYTRINGRYVPYA